MSTANKEQYYGTIVANVFDTHWDSSKGLHSKHTIDFWRDISIRLETPTGRNTIINAVDHDTYLTVRRFAYIGSNRFPSNDVAIVASGDPLDGSDV